MRTLALGLVAAIAVASCSTDDSALDAGNADSPAQTAAEVSATSPADDPEPSPDATDATGAPSTDPATTDGSTTDPATPATTEQAPTTTVAPLADLPPCPVDALAAADGPVEIVFWHGLGNELETALIGLVEAYNAGQDRVVVDLQNQIAYESIIDKYIQGNENSRPDIVQIPEYSVQAFAQSGTFVPAAACIESAGYDMSPFLPRTLSAYSFEGVQWALPFNVSSPVLYYNRNAFVAAGLDPDDPPISLDELREVSQQLVDSGEVGVGIALDSGRDSGGGWFFEQWFSRAGALYVDNDNGRTAPATRVLFNNELGLELLTYLQDLIDDGLAESVGDNAGGVDSFLKMIDETSPAAMTIATSAAISSVLAFLEGGVAPGFAPDDVGVGPMPGPSDTPGVQVGGASLWIPAGKSDEVTAAAWDFMMFMVEAQTQSTWSAGTGYVPVRTDALDLDPIKTTFEEDPRFKVAYDQMLASADDASSALPAIGPQREVRAQTADAIASVYAGADVAEVLDDTEAAANALIANYNARN